MRNTIFLSIVAMSLFSCINMRKEASSSNSQTTEAVYSSNHPDSVFFTMKKSACLGQCPVYNLTVYHSGKALLDGRDFIDFKGKHQGNFKKAELDSIVSQLISIDYFNLEKVYDKKVTDVPTTTTEFHYNNQHHGVKNRWDGPKGLKAMEKFIHKLVLNTSWTKVEE